MKKNRKGDCGCYLYRHIRHDKNEVFYIGIGDGYDYQRATSKSSRSNLWWRVVNKTSYSVEIVIDKLTKEQVLLKEQEFISLYKRKCDGGTLVNFTLGGDGHKGLSGSMSPNFGKKHTPERIENMRKAVSNPSAETRAKISASAKNRYYNGFKEVLLSKVVRGVDHPNFGKPMSLEAKAKLRAANLGKKHIRSKEYCDKISKAATLRWDKYHAAKSSLLP